MLEDKHINKLDKGIITFYFRTQKFINETETWSDKLDNIAPLDVEITGYDASSGEVLVYLPLNFHLNADELRAVIQSFRTTIIDVELVRLPASEVFTIQKDQPG